MEYRTLGRTGLKVSVLGYGAMLLRGSETYDGPVLAEDRVAEILNTVLDCGINVIDTARSYGISEARIGRHLAHRRDDYVLATKSHCGNDWSADGVRWDIENSLKALKTDHVDILQLHNPTPAAVAAAGLLEALNAVRDEGLTRFIGISTFDPEVYVFIERGGFDVFQFPYSGIQQRHRPAMEQAVASGAGILARGGVNWGGPVGQASRGYIADLWNRSGLDAYTKHMSAVELQIRHTISHPDCHTNVIGSTCPEHIRANVAAADKGPLPEDLLRDLTERVAAARRGP